MPISFPMSPEQARALGAKRRNKGQRNPRAEIRDIQRLLLEDIRNKKTRPAVRAQCARAYEVLEERMRILNGKPLPGMLRPDGDFLTKKRKAPAAVFALPEVPKEA